MVSRMLDDFLGLVDGAVLQRSGGVFYSGRSAFSEARPVYLLGLNPGGDPRRMSGATIARHIADARARTKADWSEYSDVSWDGSASGSAPIQRRVRHLLRNLGLDARSVPASNVVFVRSVSELDLRKEKKELLRACWPVHEAVISRLGVRLVICMGRTAGDWACEQLGADTLEREFFEANDRGWRSVLARNPQGIRVATLTHPARAAWDVPATDPSPLLKGLL